MLVTNGIYATGGRSLDGATTNRVVVDKPLALRSVEGPQSVFIDGGRSVRCVYLAAGAALSGFTLTNGAADFGGGVWCGSASAVVYNCVLTGNSGSYGGGADGGTLNNCTLTGNVAGNGGGAHASTLSNCTLTGNWAFYGGGAASGTLNNCTLADNWADYQGGGAYESLLDQCTLNGNSADEGAGHGGGGGGAYGGTLNSCTLTTNQTSWDGGGAYGSALSNCTLTGNTGGYGGGGASESAMNNCTIIGNSAWFGGGADSSTLNNCTLTGNSASFGGGVYGGNYFGRTSTLNNCIVYFNQAPADPNYDSNSTLNYCCTTPMPTGGVGNISTGPQLASAFHLSAFSPCIGKGDYATVSGVDIDGEPWANPPSMGCDEYHAGAVTGPISMGITANFTNVAIGHPVAFTALIEGRTDLSVWAFGDGFVEINQPYATHAWSVPGNYVVFLWCFNDSYPNGVSTTVTIRVDEGLHYVAATSATPVPPYISWATAATNIQDAVDAAGVGGAVYVTNGMYATGGRSNGRVVVDKPLKIRSVNGPQFTLVQGYQVPGATNGVQAMRCVYLSNGASLSGFTLTNGAGEDRGGGVWCDSASAVVSNCTLKANYARLGGGAYGGTLYNCTLTGNSAYEGGGGAFGSTLNSCTLTGNSAHNGGGGCRGTLNNCTLTGNSATNGGGVYGDSLNNCILYFNLAPNGPNHFTGTDDFGNQIYTFGHASCTTPLLTHGFGNITNAPLFVNQAGGNLRLQSNSPCINAGNNLYSTGSTDLDGNPRIAGGAVDLGAYEFQTPASLISYAWLQQFGLPTDGSADSADPDHDGLNNWQEWRCLTDPTNALSALRLFAPQRFGTNVNVSWSSVAGLTYNLERSTNVAGPLPIFAPLATGILGEPGTTSYTDTTALGPGPFFYRVGVQSP